MFQTQLSNNENACLKTASSNSVFERTGNLLVPVGKEKIFDWNRCVVGTVPIPYYVVGNKIDFLVGQFLLHYTGRTVTDQSFKT